MNRYIIAFDVGGTFIKSTVLRITGEVCADAYSIYPANAHDDREKLLDYLTDLVRQQVGKIIDKYFEVEGIGFAFPGPFDYERGISYIQNVDKFESLYEVDVGAEILRRVKANRYMRGKMADDLTIGFENDATLFALGENFAGKARGHHRVICLTIGTGVGSAFLEDGVVVKDRDDVPENGWVFAEPFKSSTVEDYISRRGILRIARDADLNDSLDVDGIARSARDGNQVAIDVFQQFGEDLGEMIGNYVHSFRSDVVVIGGQIAKSHALFASGMTNAKYMDSVQVEFAKDTSRSTFLGVFELVRRKSGARSV